MLSFSNISYFFTAKQNKLLPEIFSNYLLQKRFTTENYEIALKYWQGLLNNYEEIEIIDFGASSRKFSNNFRKIRDIAKISGTKPHFGSFVQKLIQSFKLETALEMGTSIGIATMFMAYTNDKIFVDGIEACPQTANFLQRQIKNLNISNIKIINNDFDKVFENNLLSNKKYDLIFIDGNHQGKYLLKYYDFLSKNNFSDKCIIILDDINWTKDMFGAWKKITRKNNACYLNFYRFGIVFWGYNFKNGVFKVKFV